MSNVSTFQYQSNLASLPIPALEDTCERFFRWIKPLISEEELLELRSEIDVFTGENGEGIKLQNSLVNWNSREDIFNWFEPFWTEEYLSPRHPAPVYGNIFYLFEENKSLDKQDVQLNRAALLVQAFLEFRNLIKKQEFPPETMGNSPLCMEPYRLLFSTTRVPDKIIDRLRLPDRGNSPTSEDEGHIVVLIRGRIFSLEVVDRDGEIFSAASILLALKEIREVVATLDYGDALGTLTAADRDSWFKAREKLLRLSPLNGRALDLIERSLFVLCLDDVSTSDDSQLAWSMLAGDPSNRWFDKSVQLIVNNDGEAAVNMEHSAIDGSPMVKATAFVADMEKKKLYGSCDDRCIWAEVQFFITDDIKKRVKDAYSGFSDLSFQTVLKVVEFKEFDRKKIKSMKVSPDGFVQMAIQLAQFKIWKRCFNTYEPATTRKFFHGRTEAIRAVSDDSMAFVQSMSSKCVPDDNKEKNLRKAIETHRERSRLCREGCGVDRHLFGLRKIWLLENGDADIPGIFKTSAYRTLCKNVISTSTTGAEGLKMSGFGPVAEDGFGVKYVHKEGLIRFVCTSRTHKSEELNYFISALVDSLSEMGAILERK